MGGSAKAFECLPAFEQMLVKCPVFPPSFLSFTPPSLFSPSASFLSPPRCAHPSLPSSPPKPCRTFCSYKAKDIGQDESRCLFYLAFLGGFFILTMLSCDCSSISRPCRVRRRSLISVLDVWMVSVLMATSLVRATDWREIHRRTLVRREGVSAGNYSVQCVSWGCKPAR